MKIFLSHSMSDNDLVQNLNAKCNTHGLQLLIAEHRVSISQTITEKIEGMIRESHVALFLLTEKGANSKFVQQEIGYGKSLNKPSIYIVQSGLEKQITGFAYGKDFIELKRDRPDLAIKKAIDVLLSHWQNLQRIEKEQKDNAALLIAGLIGLVLIAGSK